VAVEAFAAHGKKKLARADGPRVDGITLGYERADSHGARWGFQLCAATQSGFG
jgi:hypothetical protein